jgi:hypothetical protein
MQYTVEGSIDRREPTEGEQTGAQRVVTPFGGMNLMGTAMPNPFSPQGLTREGYPMPAAPYTPVPPNPGAIGPMVGGVGGMQPVSLNNWPQSFGVEPQPGTYATYRAMGTDPTIALAMNLLFAPIRGNSWSYQVRRPDGQEIRRGPIAGDGVVSDPLDRELEDRASILKRMFDPQRPSIVRNSLRGLEYGWQPFEEVWKQQGGRWGIEKLKPLLPELTSILVDTHGEAVGLRQRVAGDNQLAVTLDQQKSFVYTYDREGDNHYGRSRHENIRQNAWMLWIGTLAKFGLYHSKTANVISQIHYPPGATFRDSAGSEMSSFQMAQQLATWISQGRTVYVPNLFAAASKPSDAADLAGKSQWLISFLDAGGADHAGGFDTALRYLDALKFRGWLRSERTGMEATQSGSRADSETHTDSALLDCTLVDRDIADALSRGVVDDVLAVNWGEEARGSVYIEPAPLVDDKIATYKLLLAAILGNPGALEELLASADMEAVLDALDIPMAQGSPPPFGGKFGNEGDVPPLDDSAVPSIPDNAQKALSRIYRMAMGRKKAG